MNFRPMPFFSILMANYNKAAYIAEAVESVLAQIFSDWELIIIDDCSTDNSVEIIRKHLYDKRIKYLRNNENVGYINTLRHLVEEAGSDIVGILDSDDALEKTALEEISREYSNNPDCGYVYSQCYYCDENLNPQHLGFSGEINVSNLHENKVNAMRTFKKEAYLRTSGYDIECLHAEDIDLNLKLEEVTKLFFIDKPLYYYRVLPKSQTHSFKNTQINRSSTALAKLNAYKRRIDTSTPNLNIAEISEVLFFGVITSMLARRIKLALMFMAELIIIYPLFIIDPRFYFLIFKKIKKIIILKKEKPLLKI